MEASDESSCGVSARRAATPARHRRTGKCAIRPSAPGFSPSRARRRRIDTSKFNVHELRAHIIERFPARNPNDKSILVSTVSFGFRHGVPEDADLIFDVRFLPNPHFVREFRPLTGNDRGSRNIFARFRRAGIYRAHLRC